MVDFASFETFDPAGAGLGNLFNRLSPLEALGIWPSGDFRVEPGDGAIPAVVFYLGAALGAGARSPSACAGGGASASAPSRPRSRRPRCCGSTRWSRGTPYQEAKALVLLAPLVMLIAVAGAARAGARRSPRRGGSSAGARSPTRSRAAPRVAKLRLARRPGDGRVPRSAPAVSSLLALVNGPVGPSGYSPELAELRTRAAAGLDRGRSRPAELLDDQHGAD